MSTRNKAAGARHRNEDFGGVRTVVGAMFRCGKPSCHCARPEDPGHGPKLLLTYKWHGNTVTEALPTPAAVRKARSTRGSAACGRGTGKRTAEAIQREVAREVEQLLRAIFNGPARRDTWISEETPGWLGSHTSSVAPSPSTFANWQDRHRSSAQAIRHVLDRRRRQSNHRPSLLPP